MVDAQAKEARKNLRSQLKSTNPGLYVLGWDADSIADIKELAVLVHGKRVNVALCPFSDNERNITVGSAVKQIYERLRPDVFLAMSLKERTDHILQEDSTLLPSAEVRSAGQQDRGLAAKLLRKTRNDGQLSSTVLVDQAQALLDEATTCTAPADTLALILQGNVAKALSSFKKLSSETSAGIMFDDKTEERRKEEFLRSLVPLCAGGATVNLLTELGVVFELNESDVLFVAPMTMTHQTSFDLIYRAVDSATLATAKMSCACDFIASIGRQGGKFAPIFMSWFVQQLTGSQGRLLRLRKLDDGSWVVENVADIAAACKREGGCFWEYLTFRYFTVHV